MTIMEPNFIFCKFLETSKIKIKNLMYYSLYNFNQKLEFSIKKNQ